MKIEVPKAEIETVAIAIFGADNRGTLTKKDWPTVIADEKRRYRKLAKASIVAWAAIRAMKD